MDLSVRSALYCPLYYGEVNICVKTYKNQTPGGLCFHLSLENNVVYIVVYDIHDVTYFQMKYFTNVNSALRWINNL